MPALADHLSADYVKLLGIGDSGTGKTGSLVSLVRDGYKIRILDFDNGLDPLVAQVRLQCPDKIGNIRFISEGLRDKYKAGPGGPISDGPTTAFVKALGLLDKWVEKEAAGPGQVARVVMDLGSPATWGPDTILVIDTLTFLSDAAFNWATAMNPSAKDPRAWYKTAQDAIGHMLMMLCAPEFKTNVIVFAHVKYMDRPDGSTKGYPTSVGSALSPEIPAYFNSVALYQTQAGGKRSLLTASSALVDLKNPASFKMAPVFDLNTGLAEFFATLKGKRPTVLASVSPGPTASAATVVPAVKTA